MKGHIHSRIAKLLVVLALAVVASVMFVFVGCSSECEHEKTHTETVAATCTTAGSTKTVCDDCGETIKTETIDALGHKWDEGKVVAATCAAGGYTLKTCTVCGAQQQTDLTEALPHAWKNTTTVEPTCTTEGYTLQTCEACGATRDTNIVAAKGHKWENKEEAATCGTAGRTYQECSVCHDIRNVAVIPATGNHTWTPGTVTPATCVVDGYTEYTCSGCGATKKEVTEVAKGHKWKNLPVLREEATCTTDGYTYVECENCDERQTIDMIPATGHTYEWKVTKQLTCTTDGTITGTCKDCDAKVSYTADQYAALDKEQKDALKIDSTIITANGGEAAFLQATGHYYYSVKLGEVTNDAQHKYDTPTTGATAEDPLFLQCEDIGKVTIDEKEADYTGYALVCTHCNVKVATKAHTPDDEKAYACVDGGENKNDGFAWECTLCGHKEEMEEHTFEMVEIATGEVAAEGTAFNCLYQIKCTVCGEIEDERGPHMEPDPENPADADCLATCEHDALCTACGEAVFGGKLDHELIELDFGESVNNATAVDSTCTTQGLKVYACRMCMERAETKDVTWTTLEKLPEGTADATDGTIYKTKDGNFFTTGIGLKLHTYDKDHTVVVDVNGNPLEKADCTKEYYYIDYCAVCNNPRIQQKSATDTGDTAPTYNRPWTDAQGKYQDENDTVYPNHDFKLIVDKDTYYDANGNLKPGIAEAGYRLPNCVTDGYMMYKCSHAGCEVDKWGVVTLEAYAAKLGTTAAELKKLPEYHAGDMPACGHNVCDVCETSDIHTAQYTLTFVVSGDETVPEGAELPQIGMFTGWSCYLEDEDWARFEAFMSEINKNNTLYSLAYYRTYNAENDTYSNQIADLNAWKAMLVPTSGTDTFREKATIYVVCSLTEEQLKGETIFGSSYNTTARWIHEDVSPDRTQYLDIELYIDDSVIDPEAVTSIAVTLKNAGGAAVAGATCSTEAQLAAFVNSYYKVWRGTGWIQIEEFCNKLVPQDAPVANFDGAFSVWNTVEYRTCLDGYTLEIKFVAGGVTFERTVAITDTVEQIKPDPNGPVQIVDVPNT